MPLPTNPTPLSDYGFSSHWAELAGTHGSPEAIPARVLRAERGLCEAISPRGPLRVELGSTHHGPTPTTGDWITVIPGTAGAPDYLDTVLPRTTELARGSASGTSAAHVLAANVDTVVVAVSLAAPLRHTRTERLLALAWASGASPVVALTKADSVSAEDAARAAGELADVALGVPVIVTSATDGDGVEELRTACTGTVVLLGPSGAGKSSLGNALLGEDVLATGAVREVDGKGKHTTAWRELLPLPSGGVLLDTPGLRAVGLTGSEEGLAQTFDDVESLAASCRFADCEHRTEPGCAVLAAIDSGELTERRLESYRKLQRENAWQASRTDARLRQEMGKKWKATARSYRAMTKEIRRRDTGR